MELKLDTIPDQLLVTTATTHYVEGFSLTLTNTVH
jgi:hypothetical protein